MAETPDITLAPGTGGVEALAVGAASLADVLPGFELAVVGLSSCRKKWIPPRLVDPRHWAERLFFSILRYPPHFVSNFSLTNSRAFALRKRDGEGVEFGSDWFFARTCPGLRVDTSAFAAPSARRARDVSHVAWMSTETLEALVAQRLLFMRKAGDGSEASVTWRDVHAYFLQRAFGGCSKFEMGVTEAVKASRAQPIVLSLVPVSIKLQYRTPGLAAERLRELAGFAQVSHRVLPTVEPTRPAQVLRELGTRAVEAATGFVPVAFMPDPRGRRYDALSAFASTCQGDGKPRPVPRRWDGAAELPMLPVLLTAAFMTLGPYLAHWCETMSLACGTPNLPSSIADAYKRDAARGVIKVRQDNKQMQLTKSSLRRALEDGLPSATAQALGAAALAARAAAGLPFDAMLHVNVFAGVGVSTVGFVRAAVRAGAKRVVVVALDAVEWRLVFQRLMLEELQRELAAEGFEFELVYEAQVVLVTEEDIPGLVAGWAGSARSFSSAGGEGAIATIHLSPDCSFACGRPPPGATAAEARARKAQGAADVAEGLALLRGAEASGAFVAGTWECSAKEFR